MAKTEAKRDETGAREAVRRIVRNAAPLFTREFNRKFFRAQMNVEAVDKLVELAHEGDKDALEILRNHARGAAPAGTNAPRSLQEFVWECFIEGRPPAKSGLSPKDTELKHVTIAIMVKIVSKDYGLPEYRNPEHRGSTSGPMSACLLVAQELDLSERSIEKIWADHKGSVLRH
jgi:hypothetical protein